MKIWIRVKTKEQRAAAISWGRPHVLLLDGEAAEDPSLDDLKVFVCLPDVARQSRLSIIERIIRDLPDGAGLVVRNLDELGMLAQMRYTGELIGDSFLYAYNRESIKFYLEQFPDMKFIGSDELTQKELAELLANSRTERDRFIWKVYGYQPLMISNQCLNRNYAECQKIKQDFSNDRGERFFVQSNCRQCYSTIYNGICTWIGDRPELASCDNVLYDFTKEDPKEVRRILQHRKPGRFTRGHFEKGVE